jgi:hypothetical protein
MAKEPEVKEFTNAQLARGIAFMMNEVKNLTESMGGLVGRLDVVEKREPVAAPPTAKPNGEGADEEVDLDAMSNTEMAKWLMKTLKKDMIDPLHENIKNVELTRAQKEAAAAVNAAAAKYNDFGQWDKEISVLIEENPSLSLDDAYTLARAKAPDKAKALDDVAAKAVADEKGVDDSPSPFGGLLPTSSASSESTQMTLDDAGEAAWTKEMGDFAALMSRSEA